PYFLTPDERISWEERLRKARKGLYTPPSTDETVAVPGAVGGANWGNTAANPGEGIVYVMSQDFPSFYKLSTQPAGVTGGRGAAPGPAAGGPAQRGLALYEQNCSVCHGAERSGSAGGPTLIGLETRLNYQDFRQLLLTGRARMPAFPAFDDQAVTALFT